MIVGFGIPMSNRSPFAVSFAPDRAAAPRAIGGMMMTIIMTTTPMRGADG
jgi:hypothetical protein